MDKVFEIIQRFDSKHSSAIIATLNKNLKADEYDRKVDHHLTRVKENKASKKPEEIIEEVLNSEKLKNFKTVKDIDDWALFRTFIFTSLILSKRTVEIDTYYKNNTKDFNYGVYLAYHLFSKNNFQPSLLEAMNQKDKKDLFNSKRKEFSEESQKRSSSTTSPSSSKKTKLSVNDTGDSKKDSPPRDTESLMNRIESMASKIKEKRESKKKNNIIGEVNEKIESLEDLTSEKFKTMEENIMDKFKSIEEDMNSKINTMNEKINDMNEKISTLKEQIEQSNKSMDDKLNNNFRRFETVLSSLLEED